MAISVMSWNFSWTMTGGPFAVRYLVIDTGKWWFGKKVLVAPQWSEPRRLAGGEG